MITGNSYPRIPHIVTLFAFFIMLFVKILFASNVILYILVRLFAKYKNCRVSSLAVCGVQQVPVLVMFGCTQYKFTRNQTKSSACYRIASKTSNTVFIFSLTLITSSLSI